MNYNLNTTPVFPQANIQKIPLKNDIGNNSNTINSNITQDTFTYSSPNQTKAPDYPKPTVSKPIDVDRKSTRLNSSHNA